MSDSTYSVAEKLERYGVKVVGTAFEVSLDLILSEDRGRFSTLLEELEIPYPKFGVVEEC